jgi:hypothetical protein
MGAGGEGSKQDYRNDQFNCPAANGNRQLHWMGFNIFFNRVGAVLGHGFPQGYLTGDATKINYNVEAPEIAPASTHSRLGACLA